MDTKGISKLDLKRRNRRQILLAIRNAGMLARVDIAAQLSLTRAAVTIITNQMIAQGILEDLNTPAPAPDAPRKKGRRKTMIRINPNYKFVLGAVIDEDFVSVGLSNLSDEILGKAKLTITEKTDQKEIVNFIVRSCRDMLRKSSLSDAEVLGLGVGVVHSRWGNIAAEVQKDGTVQFDVLQKQLEQGLHMPVFCGNAVGLYALANTDYTDQEHRCQLLLYSGTFYQAAVVSDGELIGGINADFASIDHLIITPGGRKAEGYPDGSVHAELTGNALCQMVKEQTGKDLTIEQMCDAYLKNDPVAIQITHDTIDKLAVMIYNLGTAFRASRIVLQSYQIANPVMTRLSALVASLSGTSQQVKLVRSQIEGDKSFLAGCKLVMEKQFYDLGGLQPNADPDEE